jgi:hypothetical protein
MTLQKIKLRQIDSPLDSYVDFEQQMIAMLGEERIERFTATEGQQTFTLDQEYAIGQNSLKVFVNGILQKPDNENGYMEINSQMIQFTEPLFKDDLVIVVHNVAKSKAYEMALERVKAYNVERTTYFIDDTNNTQLEFETPVRYNTGERHLKIYVNGILLSVGTNFDYVETSENTFTLNESLTTGDTLTVEVISGGKLAYSCYRYPYYIDSNKEGKTTFTLPRTYYVGDNNLKVYLDGVLLREGEGEDYVEVNSNTVEMNYAPSLGSTLEFENTSFAVDIFDIIRKDELISSTNSNLDKVTFNTSQEYPMGEFLLRVYLNGVLLREGAGEDYTEVDNTTFQMNYALSEGDIIEYEIVTY